MTELGAGRALLLVAASAAVMSGTVFLVNVPRYGAGGALLGALLALLGVAVAAVVFRAAAVPGPGDGEAADAGPERGDRPPSGSGPARG